MRRQVAQSFYTFAASLKVRESAKHNTEVSQAQLNLQEIDLIDVGIAELDRPRKDPARLEQPPVTGHGQHAVQREVVFVEHA